MLGRSWPRSREPALWEAFSNRRVAMGPKASPLIRIAGAFAKASLTQRWTLIYKQVKIEAPGEIQKHGHSSGTVDRVSVQDFGAASAKTDPKFRIAFIQIVVPTKIRYTFNTSKDGPTHDMLALFARRGALHCYTAILWVR